MVRASAASSANQRLASPCTRATPFTSSRFILSHALSRRSTTFCTHCAASSREVSVHADKAPILYGNCQAGWAISLLAADCQGLVGPAVLNGSPLSYSAGESGVNPARVSGGLLGGAWLARLAADLGNGRFDGAWLVQGFENLKPEAVWDKYADLFADTRPRRSTSSSSNAGGTASTSSAARKSLRWSRTCLSAIAWSKAACVYAKGASLTFAESATLS